MPVWISTKTDRHGDQLKGWYRTEALLDAAVAENSELTKVETAILEADFPTDTEVDADYYVHNEVNGDGTTRKVVKKGRPPLYDSRALAALALLNGLHNFRDFVNAHAEGVPDDAVTKVHQFLYQKRRAVRMAYENSVEIGGTAITLTDAQFIGWATYSRFGPLDTSAVTALGVYNPEGLFDIFERANDPMVIAPSGPITWVGLDVTQWTGGVPNRLNVVEIAPVLGTTPTAYENVDDTSWLRIQDNG